MADTKPPLGIDLKGKVDAQIGLEKEVIPHANILDPVKWNSRQVDFSGGGYTLGNLPFDAEMTDKARYLSDQASAKNAKIFALTTSPNSNFGNNAPFSVPPTAFPYTPTSETLFGAAKTLTSELGAGAMEAILGNFTDPELRQKLKLFDEDEEQKPILDLEKAIDAYKTNSTLFGGAYNAFSPIDLVEGTSIGKHNASPAYNEGTPYEVQWSPANLGPNHRPFNDNGEELPIGAIMWDPNNKAYFGDNWEGLARKFNSTWKTAKHFEYGRKLDLSGNVPSKLWEVFYGRVAGKHSGASTIFKSFGGALLDFAQMGADWTERWGGTVSLAMEQEIQEAGYTSLEDATTANVERQVTGASIVHGSIGGSARDAGDFSLYMPGVPSVIRETEAKKGLELAVNRMNPIRNAYNNLQMWRGIISGKRTLKDLVTSMALNWESSRMAYSIASNDNATLSEFNNRVYIDGENPEMVARSMENPTAELIGQIIGDPLNLLDLITPATLGKLHMITNLNEMMAATDIARAIGKLDDLVDQSKALKVATEVVTETGEHNPIVNAVYDAVTSSNKGIAEEAVSFGLFKRYGSSRQSKAMTRIETYSKLLLASANDADNASDVVRLMAYVGSGDKEKIAQALPKLAELVDLNHALSPTGLEFSRYMFRMMDNGKGAINAQPFINQVIGFVNKGDIDGLIGHVLGKSELAIRAEYPTVKNLVQAEELIAAGNITKAHPGAVRFLESGGEIGKMDRAIGFAVDNVWSRVTGGVAGRWFIGSTPGPAMRGITFDTMWSTVNMGPSINFHSPRVWADISVNWFGVEHGSLIKGFGKNAIPGMNKWAKANSSLEDMGSLLDAIMNKGKKAADVGMLEDVFEGLTNYGGRMMGYFEQLSSMRVIGKAGEDAMKHYIRTGLKDVDGLIAHGLPLESARGIRQRLINAYADTDTVLKDILTEMNTIGGVDAFGDGRWITDDTMRVLEDINIQRDISKLLQKGQTRQGIVNGIEKLRAQVVANIGDVENLHITSDTMVEMFPAMHQAVADKLFDGTFALEINNVTTANGFVSTSMQNAIGYVNQLVLDNIRSLRKAGDLASIKKADELDTILKSIPSGLFDEWTNITVTNQVKNNYLFSKFKQGLADANTADDFAVLLAEAWKGLGIKADIPLAPYHADDLFDRVLRLYFSQSKMEFKNGRNAMLSIWDDFLANITKADQGGGIVQDILKSKEVASVNIMATRANSYDNIVMVNGEMKPIGPAIRALTASDNELQAVRLISSHLDPFSDYTIKGSQIADTELLRIFRRYDTVGSLDDVTADMAVQLMNKYRKEQGFDIFANSIEELIGKNIYTDIPVVAQAPAAYLYQFRTDGPDTLNALRRRDLYTFIKNNDGSDEVLDLIAKKKQIGDSSYIEDLITESQRLVDNIIEEATDVEGVATQLSMDNIPNVMPPFDDTNSIEYGRHIYERIGNIETAFDDLLKGVDDNWGKIDYANLGDEQVRGLTQWFDDANIKVESFRQGAAKYAQGMRDTFLHDYEGDKLGVDALMSTLYQFHFWPSRTALTFAKRLPYNAGKINKFYQLQEYLGKVHSDMPEWYRNTINSNEILGTDHDNPVFLNLLNFVNPFANMVGGFDSPEARVNWYSSLYDAMGKAPFGYPNIGIGLLVTAALMIQSENETFRTGSDVEPEEYRQSAALLSGRSLPITGFIKGVTSLAGVRDGKGVELDPLIRLTSEQGFFGNDVIGPHELKRVNNALALLQQKHPDSVEEIMEAARTHEGEWWDLAIRVSRRKDAVGNSISLFTGVNARLRSKDDLTIDQFWQDYIKLWSTSENMTPDEVRENLNALHKQYPFAETMLLGRRGGKERDEAYTYAIFSRVMPGKTDDMWKAMGLPYDMISEFYDAKGFPEHWEERDVDKFMDGVLSLGAALSIPADATRDKWDEASKAYRDMMAAGEEIFGPNIWKLADGAYQYKESGTSSQAAWNNYLDIFPRVEKAQDWKAYQVLDNPALSAYYGGLDAYRSYYIGVMYNELENKYTAKIFEKNTIYSGFYESGLRDEAKAYRKANEDLDAYLTERTTWYEEINKIMVEWGDTLPEGIPSEKRENFIPSTTSEESLESYLSQPNVPTYSKDEWVGKLDSYTVNVAGLIYEDIDINDREITDYLRGVASSLGMDYYTFIETVGGAE